MHALLRKGIQFDSESRRSGDWPRTCRLESSDLFLRMLSRSAAQRYSREGKVRYNKLIMSPHETKVQYAKLFLGSVAICYLIYIVHLLAVIAAKP